VAVVLNGPLGPLVMPIASHVPYRETHGCARKSECAAQKRIDKSVWCSIARNIPVDMPGAIANDEKRRVKRLETGTSDRIVASRMASLCPVFSAERECCLSVRCWRADSFKNVESPGVSHIHVGAEPLVQLPRDVYRGCVRRAPLRASRLPVHWPRLRRRARSA
jgi:hypothetical protein